MTKYKRIVTKNNRVQYWADGKMVSVDHISDDVLHHLENVPEFEVETQLVAPVTNIDSKKCLFDGSPAEHQKFIDNTTIGLCQEDYYLRTSGQIVQKLHEIQINKSS